MGSRRRKSGSRRTSRQKARPLERRDGPTVPKNRFTSTPSRAALGVLLAALTVGIGLRLWETLEKRTLIHDEVLSYLVATGHRSEYYNMLAAGRPPSQAWSDAAAWQRFFQPEERFCFRRIGRDLAAGDLHPPLYFWLLHLWCLAVGVQIWTGPALNICLAVASIFALFGLARYVLNDALTAALVCLIWAVAPNVLLVTWEARQYELLVLLTILFVWAALRCADPDRPCSARHLGFLALSTAGGLLTHYHFPILMAGCALVVARVWRRDRARFHRIALAVMCGAALFLLLHPGFTRSLRRVRPAAFDTQVLGERLERVVHRYGSFFVDSQTLGLSTTAAGVLDYALLSLTAASLVGAVVVQRRKRRLDGHSDAPSLPLVVLFLLAWLAGTNAVLYLACVTPAHAMAAKYPAMAWPFLAFLPASLVPRHPRLRTLLLTLLAGATVLGGGLRVRATLRYSEYWSTPSPAKVVASSTRVVVDHVHPGWLHRVLWACAPDQPVFAADQDYLLDNPGAWLPGLEPNTLYVSPKAQGPRLAKTRRLLNVISERHKIQPLKKWFWDLGPAFRIHSVEAGP